MKPNPVFFQLLPYINPLPYATTGMLSLCRDHLLFLQCLRCTTQPFFLSPLVAISDLTSPLSTLFPLTFLPTCGLPIPRNLQPDLCLT